MTLQEISLRRRRFMRLVRLCRNYGQIYPGFSGLKRLTALCVDAIRKGGFKGLRNKISIHERICATGRIQVPPPIIHKVPLLAAAKQCKANRIDLLHAYFEKGLILNPTIIFDHNGGGGANAYTHELVKIINADGGTVLRVYCFDAVWFVQWISDGEGMLFRTSSIKELFEVLSVSCSATIVLNSLYGYPDIKVAALNIVGLAQTLSAKLDFKIHDFYALCPSPHLLDFEDKYCGVPQNIGVCRLCLKKNHDWYHSWYPEENRPIDIAAWRQPFSSLFKATTTISLFDSSAVEILRKAFPLEENKIRIVPHSSDYFECDKQMDLSGPLHIGVLGTLSRIKGSAVVDAFYNYINAQELDIPITIVGPSCVDTPPGIKVHGHYSINDLPIIVSKQRINVILMPSIVPETFSYTISEAIKMGLPIVAFDIGAQGRRVKEYKLGKVVPLGSSPKNVLTAIQSGLKTAQEMKNSLDTKYRETQELWSNKELVKNKIAMPVDLISGLKINELGALDSDRDMADEIPGPAVRILKSIQCQHGANAGFNGQRVAVLAHWDSDAVVDPYVIHYLAHFKELGWRTILISDKAIKLTDDLLQVTDAVLYRTCPGYDFTSWKGALEYFPSLIDAEELILTNDSVFAPVGSLYTMHAAMMDVRCDFWGPVGSREFIPHLQSYYLIFRSKALRHEAFSRFWAGVQPDADRKRAIRCETALSTWLASHGLQPAVYAPMPLLNDDISNLTHDFWRELINIGTPFFKRELLKENVRNANINDCMAVLAAAGYPIHLIANYFKRIGVTPGVSMPPRAVAPEGVWPPDVRVLEIPCKPDNCIQLLPEEKAKIGTVGVFLHIYYEDLTEELVQCALCVPEPRRVYISTDTQAKEIHIRKILELHNLEAEIRVFPNRGWDIAPFLVGFADRIREHTIILRLHSKRSSQIPGDIGTHWRQTLLNILAGSRGRTQGIMRAFAHNQELGMVCPPHAVYWKDCVHFGGNYVRMEQLLSRLRITIRPDLPIDFPMGSMFWCRSVVLEPWLEMPLRFEDFEPTTPESRDQSLAHAMERLFFFGCGIAGYRWARLQI